MKIQFLPLAATMLVMPWTSTHAELIINELMQSNIDCIMDELNEFPDSWVELYNAGTTSVNLSTYRLGDSNDASKAFALPSKAIQPGGYAIVYCDKEGTGMHTSFRLESGKGCAAYLFNGTTLVDKVEGLKKQPAPNIAYGRKDDGSSSWGYMVTPTPGATNCGATCKDVLDNPVFSVPGSVYSASSGYISLELSLPSGAPAETVIRYTLDGTEPVRTSAMYTSPILIKSNTTVRAKLFCTGYLSPRSLTQSYIFLGRQQTMPVVSMVTNRDYFYSDKLGIYNDKNNGTVNGNYRSVDWRRPVNLEIYWNAGEGSVINQLIETRVKGGATRSSGLKSLVLYANKRFGEKRLNYEFFPADAEGLTDWKSLELRNSGNDFDYLYMRDAAIQSNMGRNSDLDWQPWQPTIFYINGEYKGMLNLRTRSNEDYIYTYYDGEEDVDLIENWWDLKAGTWDNYNAFKSFYAGSGQTFEEFDSWMDTGEFANIMIMNLFHVNLDFPGNNIVMWRPRAEGGRWRWIAKDTDFGLGLYGRPYNYKTLNWIYDNNFDSSNAWANQPDHTRLFRRLMAVERFRDMFIDRCAVYMGDFLNGTTLSALLDDMYGYIKDEYTRHRALFNPWWPNYSEELRNAKTWSKNRATFFYTHLADYLKLGTPRAVTIDTGRDDDVTLTINGIPLQGRSFDGKFFQGRTMTIDGTPADPSMQIEGWKVSITNGSYSTSYVYKGTPFKITVPQLTTLTIESMLGQSGIDAVGVDADGLSFEPSLPMAIYDISGRCMGHFDSQADAAMTLPVGIYIARQGQVSSKIALTAD